MLWVHLTPCRESARTSKPVSLTGFLNGAKETRTPDPLHAMQVLYQLSYGPMNAGDALELVPPSYPSLHREGDHT